MKNKQFFILILLLVIGFASISATLVINGNMKVAANLDDFDVIFIEGLLNGEPNESVVISGDKKTLIFITNKLTSKGDNTRIDYKVKNISTQYDGDVTINCTNEANEYVSITSSFDGKTLPLTNSINMQAQEVKNGYINAELTKATTEDQEVKITCKIEVNATSRTSYAYSLSFDSNGGSNVEDKIVEYNSTYGELGIPEKEGYTFIGWFNEDDEMVDETTVFDTKGNKTLTAKWASIAYPVSLKKVYSDRTETSEINIPYGESVDVLITIDEKYFIDKAECTNGYTINNLNKAIYESASIKINNNNSPNDGACTLTMLKGVFDFNYTGSEQLFKVPYDGNYKIELWGASSVRNGMGGYTSGNVSMLFSNQLFLYVGQQGDAYSGGFNGGGSGRYLSALNYHYGGGATDVRLVSGLWNDFTSLKSRIMVAAGAGSANAGGLIGYTGIPESPYTAYTGEGGSQTSGGVVVNYPSCGQYDGTSGGFGYGGTGGSSNSLTSSGTIYTGGVGGGSGYYGGGGSSKLCSGFFESGAGSSFISGHDGCDAITENSTQTNIIHTGQPNHYSGLVFTDTIMVDGAGYKWTNTKGEQTGMPTHDGKSTMTGNIGDGYAKITYLGK